MKYRVPFVDFPAHYGPQLEAEIMAAVRDVIRRGDFVLRGDLERFEADIAAFLGTKHAVGVGSGSDALNLAVRAAGLGPGDEVVTVSFTCMATIAAIAHCGATPVLVDVGEDYNMAASLVEAAITPRTRAILPVHLNGRPCNMKRIMDIAAGHGLMVIEDAAQAIGAGFAGRKAGTYGLEGCFSVYPMKMFGATGDGGFVTTDDEAVARRLRNLRDLGQDRESGQILYHGFSSRLDNIQAAILNVKLKHLPRYIEHRRKAAARYHQGLSGTTELKLPPPPDTEGPYYDVFQNYVICAEDRDGLARHLAESGIETLTSWYLSQPIHHHPTLKLGRFRLPNTERFAGEALSLPLNAEITEEQVEYVVQSIRGFYRR